MNWEAIGAVAEFLGAISVFITLVYLAIQVRENSKIQTITTYNSVVGGFSELYSWAGTTRELAAVSRYLFNEKDRELTPDDLGALGRPRKVKWRSGRDSNPRPPA